MGFKNLAVHVDHSSGCQNRVDTAFALAREYDAQITAVLVVPDYIVPSYVEAQLSVDVLAGVIEQAIVRAQETLARYQALATDAKVKLNTRVHTGQIIPILREYSNYADLLLLGQDQPDDTDNMSYGLADALLFEGGCPCLVVPHSGQLIAPGRRVLLTWNASRESARALRAALPLLARADTVVTLSAEPDKSAPPMVVDDSHAAQLTRFLRSHGIDSISNDIGAAEKSVSKAIMTLAANTDADLIVMGGYGHARLREIILGGVTRDLLKHAPVPLFIAH